LITSLGDRNARCPGGARQGRSWSQYRPQPACASPRASLVALRRGRAVYAPPDQQWTAEPNPVGPEVPTCPTTAGCRPTASFPSAPA
jgi:hypothetical protein